MRKATDTALRNLAILQAIPAYPRSKSTRQIMDDLRDLDPDFDVTVRSVHQRSLEKLSAKFPIAFDTRRSATGTRRVPGRSESSANIADIARRRPAKLTYLLTPLAGDAG